MSFMRLLTQMLLVESRQARRQDNAYINIITEYGLSLEVIPGRLRVYSRINNTCALMVILYNAVNAGSF